MSVPADELSPEAIRLPPTLVVGVGGIGCWIADRVYAKALEAAAHTGNRIVILGFDTDENDLAQLEHLKSEQLIRTSTADTVFNVIGRRAQDIADWFVDERELTTDIRQMTLLDGAGAIRMLSRLAFDAALRDEEIGPRLRSAVAGIAVQNNRDIFAGRVNVLMVGSIAGGTGSGMFLQAALTLADSLRELGITPEVRGMFLLPDIVVHAARIAKGQVRGVRANAYAALKELNAISRHTQTMQAAGGRARPVEFAYAPGRRLQPDGRPFTSVVLLDFEQTRGAHLGHNFAAYRELAANAAYALLFTPIGGRYASQAVNDIRSKHAAAAGNADNGFAGIGVSAVVYPQQEMLDYLCLCYGLLLLEGDWLRLDQEYQDELARFHARLEHGESNLEKPRIGPFYTRKLEQLADSERLAFFQRMKQGVAVRHEDDYGRQTEEQRYATYLDALEQHLLDAFWRHEPPLRAARAREELGADVLTGKATLATDIQELEGHLRKDFEAVERGLSTTVENLFYTTVLGGALLSEPEWKDYHIETYLLRGGPHLVQVRYLLYKLRELMAERARGLDAKRRREAIAKLMRAAFDDPATDAIETAGDVAEEVLRLPLPDFANWRLGRFARDYRDHYNQVGRMIRQLGEEGLRQRLYALLDAYVTQLLEVIERFFGDLADLEDSLALERNRLAAAHGPSAGLGNASRFVFADAEAKQSLWTDLRERLQGSSADDAAVNAALTRALVERFREERRPNRWQVLEPFSGAVLFRRNVIDDFARKRIRDDHGAVYRHSAVAAIQREARMRGRDPDAHLADLVDLVTAQSEPFLAVRRADAGQSYRFWALSPANAELLGSAQKVAALFGRNQGESPLVEPEFPDHTLLCLATRVDLQLADLSKLAPGLAGAANISAEQAGGYYTAYRDMVDAALRHERTHPDRPNPVFTPHLDRAWHRPGVLPEIHPELEAEQNQQLMDAYVRALALDLLPREARDGSAVTLLVDYGREGLMDFKRVIAKQHDDLPVLGVMSREPAVIAAVLERWEQLAAQPADAVLHAGLSAPRTLVRIGELLRDRTRAQAAAPLVEGAIAALVRNLAATNERVNSHLGVNARRAELEQAGLALIEAAVQALAGVLDDEGIAHLRDLASGQLNRHLSGAAPV